MRLLEMLGRRQETLVSREKALLGDLREFLVDFDASPVDLNFVERAVEGLDELFMIVVVGEYNSGKSSFINALVGETVCEEGSAPTTSKLTLLRHGDEASERISGWGVLERRRNNDYLREVSILDTPPTNAEGHQARLLRYYVPTADLVLFVTSAERPITESGRMFLQQARRWARKVVIVANKTDRLSPGLDVSALRSAIEERAREALDAVPPTFLISTLQARKAAATNDVEGRRSLVETSGLPELEAHIADVLSEEDRLRLKLESALNPIEKLYIRYQFAIDERLGLLDGDLKIFENARSQLEFFLEDMKRDFASRRTEIEAVISRMGTRGDAWFEENVRLGNAVALTRTNRIRERFQAEVVAGAEEQLDERINELVDWMVERNLEQWRSMVDYVEKRHQAEYDEAMLREIGDGFGYDRDLALLSLGERARKVVSNYDRSREAEQIALSLRGAASRTALAEAGALGMAGGAAASSSFAAAAAITLTLGTLLLGGLGLFVLPNRRRGLGEDFRKNNDALRRKLGEAISEQFFAELDRSAARLDAAISQYGEFTRVEQARMEKTRRALESIHAEAAVLRDEIAMPALLQREDGG